jgi:hypothetical protein
MPQLNETFERTAKLFVWSSELDTAGGVGLLYVLFTLPTGSEQISRC